jgi:single-stranded-DNA-specific exonuclease
MDFARDAEALAPFGKANEKPVFCVFGVLTEQISIIGENCRTLRFTFTRDCGNKINAVWFNKVEEFAQVLRGTGMTEKMVNAFRAGVIKKLAVKLDIAFTVELNEFRGEVSEQLRIAAVRPSRIERGINYD